VRVLVMGGTQFNGLALVRGLARSGHEVTVCNRGRTRAKLPQGVRRLVCDRSDHEALRAVLGGEDFDVVHDVSAYRPDDVRSMIEIFRGRIAHYVFASSTVTYAATDRLPIAEDHPQERGGAQDEYGLNKILCEDLLLRAHRESGFPATITAYSMVFGPNNIIPDREQRMFVRLLRGRKVLVPGDGTTLGMVGHVDDQARALRMLMQQPVTHGRRYILTGDTYYSDDGYVDTIASVLGVDPEKVRVPAELMDDLWSCRVPIETKPPEVRADTRATAAPDARRLQLWRLQGLIQRLAPNLHHWNRSVLFSVERLKRDIGWTPEYDFRGAVEQTWEWFQREGLDRTRDFDFAWEDDLLARVAREAG